jgi:hypothetical protein
MVSSLYAPRSLRRTALWRAFLRPLLVALPRTSPKILALILSPKTDRP